MISRAVGHINTDAAVVDCNGLEIPEPVPIHEYGCLDVVEDEIASRELLAPKEGAVMPAIEHEVGHPAAGAVVHEDALLSVVVTSLDHLKTDVLETSSLYKSAVYLELMR